MTETWIRQSTVYEGKIIRLRTGDVRLDDGTVAHREVVDHGGGVGVVPVIDDSVLLVRQFRVAVGKDLVELPAGRLEAGEDPRHRASTELEEETGYQAGRLVHVASCYCSPGFTNELDHIYLAFDLTKTRQNLEFDERVELVHIPLSELDSRLANREFEDAKTVIGLRELQVYLRAQNR